VWSFPDEDTDNSGVLRCSWQFELLLRMRQNPSTARSVHTEAGGYAIPAYAGRNAPGSLK
jgi:hypothetical protein